MTSDTAALLHAATAWAKANYPGVPVECVAVHLCGLSQPVRLPVPPHQPIADPSAGLSDCEGDILTVLERAGKRMKGDELKKALQDADMLHGDSTITKALAALGRERKLLTNRRDTYGQGYGLAEWTDGG